MTYFFFYRLYFFKFVRLLSMKFARLEILDQGIPKQLSASQSSSESPVRKRIEKGQFQITNHAVEVDRDKALFMVFSEEQSPYLAIALHGFNDCVLVCIWDMDKNKEIAKIHTGLGKKLFIFIIPKVFSINLLLLKEWIFESHI